MTPLHQRMLDALVVRRFSPRTQGSYLDAIYGIAKHYRRDPAQYTAQEIDAYLLHMIQQRYLSYSTMNQAACAARFLYEKVLGRERELFPIAMAMAKVPAKQPELLAREEIARLFACCAHPVHRMLLQTMYAAGLRVSEACALRVADIDSHTDSMCHSGGLRQRRARPLHRSEPDLVGLPAHLRSYLSPLRWSQCLAVLRLHRHPPREHPVGPARLPRGKSPREHHEERWPAHPAPRLCHPLARRRR